MFLYRKSSIKPPGAYLISGPNNGGVIIEGGGGLFKIRYFRQNDNNFPNLTIPPVTKTEQEFGLVSPVLQVQRHLYPNSKLLLEIKTKFQYKVTETKRNVAETSFA